MSEVLEVPEGWEVKSLEELCEVVGGGTPKRDDDDNWLNGLIPWATPTDITAIKNSNFINGTKEKITKYGLKNSSSKLLPVNSILLTSRATIGARKINTIPMCTNQGFTSLIPKENNTKFLFYMLSKYEKYMNSRAYGTTFPEISKTEVKNVKVLLPSKMIEQQKIAKILSTLDSAIEASQKLIAKEKNIKKGLMHDLLTNGIDENGTIRSPKTHKYKESELGLIPVEWEINVFSSISKINMGQSPDSEFVNENQKGIAFLQGNADFGEISPKESYWVTKPKKMAKKGDVLISVRAPVGDINIADKEYCIGRGLASITIDKIDSSYGFYSLFYERKQLDRLSQGSTFLAIGKNDFDQLKIKNPKKIQEQQKIATILTAQDKKIETEEKNLEKLKELKKSLMHDLLSGKVRVKV